MQECIESLAQHLGLNKPFIGKKYFSLVRYLVICVWNVKIETVMWYMKFFACKKSRRNLRVGCL